MMGRRTGSALLISALAATAATTSTPTPQTEGDVRFTVYSDVATIAPGSTFHLAFEFTIEKDWHIYWLNPGDSGIATSIEIKAPEGFTVGPILFPGPQRIEDAGMVSYGYETAATLIAEVKAPEALTPGEALRFDIRSDWLVCKQTCVLGSAETTLALKTAEAGQSTRSPDTARLAKAKERLPQPLKEFKVGRAGWSGSAASARFDATVPKGFDIEIFPLLVEGVESCPGLVEGLPDGSRRLAWVFDVDVNRLGPAPPPSVGVVRVKRDDEERFFDLVPQVGK